MKKSSNNLSALFRSLGPDEPEFETIAKVAAPEAEKPWPLFKAVPPAEQQPTPPLTTQERKNWSKQEKLKVELPRPTLSMSGLSSKLSDSLSQISKQILEEESDEPTVVPEKVSQRALGQVKKDKTSERAPRPVVSASAKSLIVTAQADSEDNSYTAGKRVKPSSQTALGQEISQPKSKTKTQTKELDAVKSDDRLSNIFNRLEEKEEVTTKPVVKSSSLLKRIGKR